MLMAWGVVSTGCLGSGVFDVPCSSARRVYLRGITVRGIPADSGSTLISCARNRDSQSAAVHMDLHILHMQQSLDLAKIYIPVLCTVLYICTACTDLRILLQPACRSSNLTEV
jgi:hypothetical protein